MISATEVLVNFSTTRSPDVRGVEVETKSYLAQHLLPLLGWPFQTFFFVVIISVKERFKHILKGACSFSVRNIFFKGPPSFTAVPKKVHTFPPSLTALPTFLFWCRKVHPVLPRPPQNTRGGPAVRGRIFFLLFGLKLFFFTSPTTSCTFCLLFLLHTSS